MSSEEESVSLLSKRSHRSKKKKGQSESETECKSSATAVPMQAAKELPVLTVSSETDEDEQKTLLELYHAATWSAVTEPGPSCRPTKRRAKV